MWMYQQKVMTYKPKKLKNYFFLASWKSKGLVAVATLFIYFVFFNACIPNHIHTTIKYNTVTHFHSPRHFLIALVLSGDKPPWGAEPRFELGPAVQPGHRTTNWADEKAQDPDPDTDPYRNQVYGSEDQDPDLYQNVTDPDQWKKSIKMYRTQVRSLESTVKLNASLKIWINWIQIRIQDLDLQIRIQPRIFDDLSAPRSPESIFMNTWS